MSITDRAFGDVLLSGKERPSNLRSPVSSKKRARIIDPKNAIKVKKRGDKISDYSLISKML